MPWRRHPFGYDVALDFRVGKAADVQSFGIRRAAAEADRVRPEPFLEAEIAQRVAHRAIVGGRSDARVRIPRMDRELDDHVRQLVEEMENEIGEDGFAVTSAGITGDGQSTDGHANMAHDVVEQAVREILLETGEDPDREGLRGTPSRVRRMYAELTAGYHVDPDRLVNNAIFDVDYSEMVVVKDIPFYSLCEHHLLPFFGQAAVAYIPEGRVIGLSKIPRIVEMYSRRLQVQERMTKQIADFLMERLQPRGVGVVVEASHLCAVMRGVRKPGTIMTTSHVLGCSVPPTARGPSSSPTSNENHRRCKWQVALMAGKPRPTMAKPVGPGQKPEPRMIEAEPIPSIVQSQYSLTSRPPVPEPEPVAPEAEAPASERAADRGSGYCPS